MALIVSYGSDFKSIDRPRNDVYGGSIVQRTTTTDNDTDPVRPPRMMQQETLQQQDEQTDRQKDGLGERKGILSVK